MELTNQLYVISFIVCGLCCLLFFADLEHTVLVENQPLPNPVEVTKIVGEQVHLEDGRVIIFDYGPLLDELEASRDKDGRIVIGLQHPFGNGTGVVFIKEEIQYPKYRDTFRFPILRKERPKYQEKHICFVQPGPLYIIE